MAIFCKAKSMCDTGEPSDEKREHQEYPDRHRGNHRPRCDEAEVATADRPLRSLVKNGGDHFQKLMDLPCRNHVFPVCHKIHECKLLKRFISKTPSEKVKPEELIKPTEKETPRYIFPRNNGVPHDLREG